MKIDHEFTVARPIEDVWAFFQDIPAVADCLPGAELKEQTGEDTYAGGLSVKLGPMTAAFEGEATIEPDDDNKAATISGKGVDKRGGSRGQVKLAYGLESQGAEETKVDIDADIMLSGPAAQFGRTGLINEISKRLIDDFVACIEAKLAATSEEEASQVKAADVNAITLFFQSLISWFKKLFGRRD